MSVQLSLVLMQQILDVVKESGARDREAECALKAALALIPELGLVSYDTTIIYGRSSGPSNKESQGAA